MNAPSTPIIGTRLSRSACLTFCAQKAINPPDTTHIVPPTAGEIKASAICMFGSSCLFFLSMRSVNIGGCLCFSGRSRRFGFDVERAVYLTVLHRLCVSGSDRAAEKWRRDYRIPGTESL